jgi:predicted transcriptional regulator
MEFNTIHEAFKITTSPIRSSLTKLLVKQGFSTREIAMQTKIPEYMIKHYLNMKEESTYRVSVRSDNKIIIHC